jgi:hypothetical protein
VPHANARTTRSTAILNTHFTTTWARTFPVLFSATAVASIVADENIPMIAWNATPLGKVENSHVCVTIVVSHAAAAKTVKTCTHISISARFKVLLRVRVCMMLAGRRAYYLMWDAVILVHPDGNGRLVLSEHFRDSLVTGQFQ